MTLQELSAQREAEWLAMHGEHSYHLRDLVAETRGELADGNNYTKAEMKNAPEEARYLLADVMYHLELAWLCLDVYERRKAILAKRGAQGEVNGE